MIMTHIPPDSKPEPAQRIKGMCSDCVRYHDCPRMRGESICYGKKYVLTSAALPPSDQEVEGTDHERKR